MRNRLIKNSIVLAVLLLFGTMAIAQRSPRQELQYLYNTAYQLQKDYKPSDAIRCLYASLKIDSNFIPAYNLMGYIFEESFAQYDSAEYYYQKTLHINPRYVKGYINLGHLAYLRRDYTQAVSFNEKALQLDTNCAEAYFNLGWIANEQNLLHEAIIYMKKASQKGSGMADKWLASLNERNGERLQE